MSFVFFNQILCQQILSSEHHQARSLVRHMTKIRVLLGLDILLILYLPPYVMFGSALPLNNQSEVFTHCEIQHLCIFSKVSRGKCRIGLEAPLWQPSAEK